MQFVITASAFLKTCELCNVPEVPLRLCLPLVIDETMISAQWMYEALFIITLVCRIVAVMPLSVFPTGTV